MRNTIFVCIVLLSHLATNAQNIISGRISDQDNNPLSGATVFIHEMNKGTISDNQGNFELTDLPRGKIKLQFSYLGHTNRVETVELKGLPVVLSIRLTQTPIEAEEIVVSGGYNSTQHDNAVKIDVFKLNPLAIKNTPDFMEVLTRVPGVDMISKGSGVSKPVVRGLSMNDILVLNNSVRFENYQYSSHHPLGIDEFGIEDVEIIKGPASLLYGSDAIGGVINFIKEKPAPVGTITGDYNMQLFSNSLGMTNNLGIKGASARFFGGIRAGQKTNADYLQGGGDLVPNSRFNEKSIKANAGYTSKIGTFKLFYDYKNQKLGLVEDEAIEAISERGRQNNIWYQQFNTHLLSSQNKIYAGRFRLDLNAACQSTELFHVGEQDDVELQMRLTTITWDAKLHLPAKEQSEYIFGVQGFSQKNENLNNRETILLPDATTANYSAFGLLQHTFFKKLKLQTGIRYDYKSITTREIGLLTDSMNFRAAVDKHYGSFSGSFGGTYNVSDHLLFRLNFAAAYRTPTLAELTSNGQHELRYEIGNMGLVPENAYETDFSLHYHQLNFTFDVAGFYNIVNNFIFITPTGDTTASGISIYKYRQSNSVLFGGEAGIHLHPKPVKWLHLEATFSSVIGKQQNGDYLPFVPAHKLHVELRAEKEKLLFLHQAFISLVNLTAFDQNIPAPDETATKGYSLFDLSIGGTIRVQNQYVSISISGNNLLDTKYYDHLSTLKEVGLCEPGRNIALSLKVPFGILRAR